MIDFFKIVLHQKYYDLLLNNPLLEFNYLEVSVNTSEIKKNYLVARHNGLTFELYESKIIIIKGSFHYLFNNGLHNYNDFKLKDFKEVVMTFIDNYNINPTECTLNQLEVGLNLKHQYNTNKILRHAFFHKGSEFSRVKTKTEGNYYLAEHYNYYWFKLYNKRVQFNNEFDLTNEIIRLELKFYSRKLVNDFNIKTLNDLLNFDFNLFKKELLNQWEKVLFFDYTINHPSLSLNNYRDKNYWIDLKENTSRSNYNNHRNKLDNLTKNYSNNIKKEFSNLIEQKAIQLIG